LFLQGGVGIEIWTMTSDILFSNIYVGHSIDDAKKLAAETFDVKHPIETAKPKDEDIKFDDETQVDWKEDPVAFIREKVFSFVELAKVDPVLAFKTKPETGAALAGALFTLFGMLGAVFGLVGGQQKPVTKVWAAQIMNDGVLTLLRRFSHRKRLMRQPRTIKRRRRRLQSHLLVGKSKQRAV
jgi:hypothetical protein